MGEERSPLKPFLHPSANSSVLSSHITRDNVPGRSLCRSLSLEAQALSAPSPPHPA